MNTIAPGTSDGDILQSQCLALAFRMNTVDAPFESVQRMGSALASKAVDTGEVRPAVQL